MRKCTTQRSIVHDCTHACGAGALCEMLSRSHLTVLALDNELNPWNRDGAIHDDEHIAALTQAIPQLRALRLSRYATNTATDAGLQARPCGLCSAQR